LLKRLESVKICGPSEEKPRFSHDGFHPNVTIKSVHFRYPGSEKPAIQELSTQIDAGTMVAIVGPTGSGKTTTVDLLLGIFYPDAGQVLISGLSPSEAILQWPGAISYVPQDVVIANGTIKQNVCQGFNPDEVADDHVWEALSAAQLDSFVRTLPKGIDSEVGERGTKISGGQRQRLGIARALFTKPQLLVLDEATSSLDGETEAAVTSAIQALKGHVTVIVIAHRLSTVRSADSVIYFNDGKAIAQGTFHEVRTMVPGFDRQAKLMGL
jgi:ABC-type multidrug transport system fused ATPase/permease subunit